MNERIKLLRKKLGLSQEAFGARLEITKASISRIESGINNPSDQTIRLICREFNVNEEWLRTGSGGIENMFLPEDIQYIYETGHLEGTKNEFKKFYLHMMMNLPDEYWDYLYNEFMKFRPANPSNSTRVPYNDVPSTPEELEKLYPPIKDYNKHIE